MDLSTFILLGGLQDKLITQWIGPAFIIVVAAVAVTLAWKKQFRELLSFVAIAAICGALIWGASELFGSGGKGTTTVKDTIKNF